MFLPVAGSYVNQNMGPQTAHILYSDEGSTSNSSFIRLGNMLKLVTIRRSKEEKGSDVVINFL